jgi:hypothetical protein
MRFLSVLFAGGVAAAFCLTSFSQTADQGYGSQQQAAPAAQAPANNSPTPQLKLEDLPPDPRTPTAEEEAAQAVERQRAQIMRVAASMANWGPKASSPGITLTMKETSRTKGASATLITYRLAATGFAPGTRLTLLRWPLNQNVLAVMNGIVIDASGTAVCGAAAAAESAPAAPSADGGKTATDAQTARQSATPTVAPCTKTMQVNAPVEITTEAAKGEAIRVALVAEDKKGGAAASVVPFPIAGEDKGCRLQILLGSKDAELVLIDGNGFKADTPFTMGAETFGQKASIAAKPDAKGHFTAAMTPYLQGHDSGDTVVYYQSDVCTPTVSFHWGKGSYKAE